jgi:hypothetical protein
VRLERLGHGMLQQGCGAGDAQHGFLLQAGERFALPELGLQADRHAG